MINILPVNWPVTQNSNFVGQGSTFFAIKGHNFNGLDFIQDALQKGASKIVTDQEVSLELQNLIQSFNAELILVENALKELPLYASKAWNFPAKKLKIVGVTGTKGKTTTTFLLHHILKELGLKTAMISGVKNIILDFEFKSELTTPHADFVQAFLAACVEQGVEYVVMETSAQALTLHRVDAIEFDGAIFTNLSQEHAEFYSSMQEYFNAKKELFSRIKKNGAAIINISDDYGKNLYSSLEDLEDRQVFSLSTSLNSDFVVQNAESSFQGLSFEILHQLNFYKIFSKTLIGLFNALNCADAFALVLSLGFSAEKIIKAIETFNKVPGRMESYKLKSGALGVVDYAHTPSSYTEILSSLRKLTNNLIVVFGAGGQRDPVKRPIMGEIAGNYADKIFVTSDNPRTEDPDRIAQDIISGIKDSSKVFKELDREKAIQAACKISDSESIVVVLGKGPDEYQIIGKEKFFFSDKDILSKC